MQSTGDLKQTGGKRRMWIWIFLGFGLLAVVAGVAWQNGHWGTATHPAGTETAKESKAETYTCGMHPQIISDKPGKCPICGMNLTLIEEMPETQQAAPAQTPAAGTTVPAAGSLAVQEQKSTAGETKSASPAKAETYTCGMHPQIISDKPGKCPICGMNLTLIEEMPEAESAVPAPTSAGGVRKLLFYRNPMDPMITSAVPKKDEMGMDYVPVYEDEIPKNQEVVEGRVAVRLSSERLQAAGVQTVAAKQETIRRSVRTVGIVTPDETLIRHVHTKIDGWVENLQVNFRGQLVEKGEPILSLYSPTLLAGQEEYLRAREAAKKFSTSTDESLRQLGRQLFEAARRRLELYDVPENFIAELDKTGTVKRTVTLEAPVSGFVTAKDIFEGQQVSPGSELFTITDLSRVWIEADLYEYEARAVAIGQEAVLDLPFDPGVTLTGRVTYVNPFLTPESRTLKVRFEFANPNFMLKPAMFADVTLVLETQPGVVVPDSALMDTGVRKLVFVQTTAGSFAPREVRVGLRADGQAQILSGVEAGELVVIKANFLIDSESRLRGALLSPAASPASPDNGHGGH